MSNVINDLRKGFVRLMTGEPEKTFKRAGILGENSGIPTRDGVKLYVAWKLKQKEEGEAFKKEVVDKMIEEANE